MSQPANAPKTAKPKGGSAAPSAALASTKRTLQLGLLASLLCYLAHPPIGWSMLAWVGPTPWLLLARAQRLPGRRPYLALWLSGSAFWLAAIQWIRLPYGANIVFLFMLAFYLGAYIPLFVGLTRVAVHRLKAPLWLAGAVTWTGLELARAHLLTGFLMASLAHTQAAFPAVIQIADLAGEYGVTFLIVLVAGAIAGALPLRWATGDVVEQPDRVRSRAHSLLKLAPACVALVAAIAYGEGRLYQDISHTTSRRRAPAVLLVQSDMLSDWKGTFERDREVMDQQVELTLKAIGRSPRRVDLVVWPETMFRQRWVVNDDKNPPHAGALPESVYAAAPDYLKLLAKDSDAALLVGIDRVIAAAPSPTSEEPCDLQVYNSAVFVDRSGELRGSYDKMHLLPFGEFIPFAAWFPALAKYAPISGNSLWGAGPASFELDDVRYAPSICYETVLPHLIRSQVVELAGRRQTPDVLVNLTNDAWYWGSSELDMHLASGVFRAVEMRMPLVIAANRGLSAYVDSCGRLTAVTQRDRADTLAVAVELPTRAGPYRSFYAQWGDWLPMSCLVCCVVLAAIHLAAARRESPPESAV